MSLRTTTHKWITDAARTEVVQKLMEDQCARNIAVGAARAPLKGGFQSDTVLRLRIDVHLIAKVAGPELLAHAKYLSFVNRMLPRMFPEVLSIVALESGKYALFMEDIVNRESGLDLVFRRPTKTEYLVTLIAHTFVELDRLHGIPCDTFVPELTSALRDLYTPRLYKKLKDITELDSTLDCLWNLPCEVFGHECPPLKETLRRIEAWVERQLRDVTPTFLHGDSHLGNIFYQAGSSGRVRFIDPSPDVAYGDPFYDFGKLLHWIEPVGWAAYNVMLCQSRINVQRRRNKVTLSAWLSPQLSQAAERRRQQIENAFYDSKRFVDKRAQARLALSVAAAHSGLARLLAQQKQVTACRYVIAYLLRALCRWHDLVN